MSNGASPLVTVHIVFAELPLLNPWALNENGSMSGSSGKNGTGDCGRGMLGVAMWERTMQIVMLLLDFVTNP